MTDKRHLGHTARKRFGQNFLCDDNVIGAIVSAINPTDDDLLIEIGPGLGALTEVVCEYTNHLNVVELDRDLAKRLRHHPFIHQKLNVIEADALSFNFNNFFEENHKDNQKIKVFGNLPYNISTPLIFHLLTYHHKIDEMHFMLQKEVVKRLCASPHSKAYGRLTIMTQYFCEVLPVIEVPPSAFKPAPKVDSAVVRLVPYKELPHPCKSVKVLNQVVTIAFNQRRKTLKNSLSELLTEDEIVNLGLNITARAENLSLKDYVAIADYVFKRNELS